MVELMVSGSILPLSGVMTASCECTLSYTCCLHRKDTRSIKWNFYLVIQHSLTCQLLPTSKLIACFNNLSLSHLPEEK